VWVAGLVAAIGVSVLGFFCFLSVVQLAMLSSKEKVMMKYSVVVVTKLALGLLATLLAIAAAGLFALQADDREHNGFEISRGPGFYIQILLIVLTVILFVMSIYDVLFSRRDGGDPTRVAAPLEGATIGNPGFRERTNGVSP
jgi:cytochrome c biogenesis factor